MRLAGKGVSWLVALASTAVFLAVAEGALRLAARGAMEHGGWGWEASPHRAAVAPKLDPPNALGLRGQAIRYEPGDYVVLLVGDSQVESAPSEPGDMPERLLEAALRDRLARPVRVFSIAAAGWAQDQELLALRAYFSRFRADAVVLWATPGNDFWENAFPVYGTTLPPGPLKPTFRLRGEALEGPFYAQPYLYRSAVADLVVRAWSALTGPSLERRVLDDWIAILPPSTRRVDPGAAARCAGSVRIDQGRFSYDVFALDERYTIVTDEDFPGSRSHFAPFLESRSARDTYLLDLSRRLYREIESLVRAHGAAFRVFHALREDFDVRYRQHVLCVTQGDASPWPLALDYRAALEATVDARSLFVFAIGGQDEIVVSKGDRHLNKAGNTRVMSEVARELAALQGASAPVANAAQATQP